MPILQAASLSVAAIHFNAKKCAGLRQGQIEHLAYHMIRLLAGEHTAASEWRHLGLTIEVEPDSDGGPEE